MIEVKDFKGHNWWLYDIGVFRGYNVSRKGLMEVNFGIIMTEADWDLSTIKVPVFTAWWPEVGSHADE